MANRISVRRALRLTVSAFLLLMEPASSHSQESSSINLPASEIRALANRILQRASKADCNPGDCTVLVPNFTLASGFTSRLGMQIADQVSKELASQQNAIKIVDYFRFQSFLEQERIPAALFHNEKAICWLGKELGANAVLRGTTENRGGPLRVEASLLSCDRDKAGPIEEFSVSDFNCADALNPIEAFPQALPASESFSAPFALRAGLDGVTSPICLYCPVHNYPDTARAAQFTGTVLLDVTVSAEGQAIDTKVVHGAPFGLNQAAIKSVRDWHFKPATRAGEPVPCRVQIETTYRLN
jgi:TonB family protein